MERSSSSQRLISRSPDLKRLDDEGYEVRISSGSLLITHVPYVDANQHVQFGTLVSELALAGDITTTPGNHVVTFAGTAPCDPNGILLDKIINSNTHQIVADNVAVDFTFSSKPPEGYPDYYAKMTAYIAMLSSPAQVLEPSATATTFPTVEPEPDTSVFRYLDTASSRAGIEEVTRHLELGRVAIVGLGGTGGYVLDLVAKTPVREIHLYDGDRFLQHNAFRSPGAASLEELQEKPQKVAHFTAIYTHMRHHVIPHDVFIDESNVEQLRGMDFVFLAFDKGPAKRLVVERLVEYGVPFVDVGLGVFEVNGSLAGLLRVTSATALRHDHVASRIPFSDGDVNNDYSHNIQIADLNALNAALAVVKWKKHFGFYVDLEREHHSTYQIDGNTITNEDMG